MSQFLFGGFGIVWFWKYTKYTQLKSVFQKIWIPVFRVACWCSCTESQCSDHCKWQASLRSNKWRDASQLVFGLKGAARLSDVPGEYSKCSNNSRSPQNLSGGLGTPMQVRNPLWTWADPRVPSIHEKRGSSSGPSELDYSKITPSKSCLSSH